MRDEECNRLVAKIGQFSNYQALNGATIGFPPLQALLAKQMLSQLNPKLDWLTADLTELHQPLQDQEDDATILVGNVGVLNFGEDHLTEQEFKAALGDNNCFVTKKELKRLASTAKIITNSNLVTPQLFSFIQNNLIEVIKKQDRRTLREIVNSAINQDRENNLWLEYIFGPDSYKDLGYKTKADLDKALDMSMLNLATNICHAQEVHFLVESKNINGEACNQVRGGLLDESNPNVILSVPGINLSYGGATAIQQGEEILLRRMNQPDVNTRELIHNMWESVLEAAKLQQCNRIVMPAIGLGAFCPQTYKGVMAKIYFEELFKLLQTGKYKFEIFFNPIRNKTEFDSILNQYRQGIEQAGCKVRSVNCDVKMLAIELAKADQRGGPKCAILNPSDSDVLWGKKDVGQHYKSGDYVTEEDLISTSTGALGSRLLTDVYTNETKIISTNSNVSREKSADQVMVAPAEDVASSSSHLNPNFARINAADVSPAMAPRLDRTSHSSRHIAPAAPESNWILVSMGSMQRLQYNLENFRKSNGKPGHVGSSACSSTLIWSGTKDHAGNNVGVRLFGDSAFGFSLDPTKILVPHAEFMAYRTGSIVPEEEKKSDRKELFGGFKLSPLTTKYPNKQGRFGSGMGQDFFTTNEAKWEHLESNVDVKRGIYHSEGSAELFAQNVKRKFIKRNNTRLNEALVLQKGEVNPINGIVIRAELFNQISATDKAELVKILRNRSDLKMYIYDSRLPEHIVREVDNSTAIRILSSRDNTIDASKFPPFKGFTPVPSSLGQSILTPLQQSLGQHAQEFINQNQFLVDLGEKELTTQMNLLAFSWGDQTPFNFNDAEDALYDICKQEFVEKYESEINDHLHCNQIFNDVVRERIINTIAQQDERFARRYNQVFMLLELDRMLDDKQYKAYRDIMLNFIKFFSKLQNGSKNFEQLTQEFNHALASNPQYKNEKITKGFETIFKEIELENSEQLKENLKNEARKFIEAQKVFKNLESKALKTQIDLLGYSWGGYNCSTGYETGYEQSKYQFNILQPFMIDDRTKNKVFNDAAREHIINTIAQQDAKFAIRYNQVLKLLDLDRMLLPEQYKFYTGVIIQFINFLSKVNADNFESSSKEFQRVLGLSPQYASPQLIEGFQTILNHIRAEILGHETSLNRRRPNV